jgi:hypothetical protein
MLEYAHNLIGVTILIQSGGGTGPTKPGNRSSGYGANSDRVLALKDESG